MMLDSIKPRVAIYIRVSTHYQIDKDSLPMQREDLTNYCKYIFNTDEYEIFEDAGYSGKDTGRPAFQEMMIKIRKKEFTHILVWKIDRISRNLLDFSTMYEELKKYGVTFVSKNEQFDTSTAMGEAMLKIILVFAELERKLTSERVTATMLSRAVKGLWNGANVPLGYEWNEEKKFPVPNDKERKTVELIYSKYIRFKSCDKLSNYLNNNNISTKRGGFWTSKTVNDILRNPFYKGTYRYNYKESGGGKKKPESEWIIIENNHEPIIDETLWNMCNDILNQNGGKVSTKFRNVVHTHIFSKKLVCKKCGNTFIACKDRERTNGFRPSIYRCAGNRSKHICDAKMCSDIVIGSFIFELLRNIVQACSKFCNTPLELQNKLLNGISFSNVKSINIEDLELLYVALYKTELKKNELNINSIQDSILSNSENNNHTEMIKKQINKFNKERSKYKKALERLEDLYLFSEKGINKTDYIQKKQQYEEKLRLAEDNLRQFYRMNDSARNLKDMSFLLGYEKFLFNSTIKGSEFDYTEFAMNINNNVLKDFIDSIIEKIEIENSSISCVFLKNGLKLRFENKIPLIMST
ncbi:recombinase family protein [Peptostreptococcus sp. D1]|uniref:recombinase family protein n=1 Tax=Peptostreptococcus sp. D1 TaxID=72304 RepID=UPI0008E14AC8|nr:recombinase family protein [Peptostreptococcus sp. D1]SFE89258.1 Site-specific DNA recombinase [Peptostreptococcus sp. D1]